MTSTGSNQAPHVPVLVDRADGGYGVIRGHVARANPLWRAVRDGDQVLVIFQGPDHYVSPAWYPGKREDPRQVPTWDYLVVEARGTLVKFDDEARLYNLLTQLTDHNEAGREHRWRVTDAPDDYVRKEMHHIIGIELHVESLNGRYKLRQNRNAADQEGARAGLADAPTERERNLASAIAAAQHQRNR